MKTVALLVAALAGGALCPPSIHCDFHNATASRRTVEYRNGRAYGVYEHYYWEGDKRQTHSLREVCE